jgi:hypothetical protein
MIMKTLALMAGLLALTSSAHAQPLQVKGKFGFLGEFEISAAVAPKNSLFSKEFAGAMTVRHVGLCTHDGPDEFAGQMRLQKLGAARVKATLQFEGRECSFSGELSESRMGVLTCPGERLPIGLWLQ